ncbi:electron transporter RnfD [bacterium]|nr:electron transporter RnfD [bacterium]
MYTLLCTADNSSGCQYISPDNSSIQYTGRIDFSDPEAPLLFWPGTYIKADFQGTSLQIILDDSLGRNFYNIILDNNMEDYLILCCRKGTHTYPAAVGLKDTIHSMMIFRRTEGFSGPTRFRGLILDKNRTLADPPERPPHKIEFYGNSITCGMGNEVPDQDEDENNARRNNFMAYGAITARNLNADYTCIAKSGIGIMISWFDIIMPEYYDRLDPWNPDSRWDFSRWTPDVVVINLFQNDSWLINKLDPVPDENQIIQAYSQFVKMLRNQYPEAYILCTLGSMDAVNTGSPWPGYIQKAVDQCKKKDGKNKIDTLFFDFDGTYKHPRIRHHQSMAKKLTTCIKKKLNW